MDIERLFISKLIKQQDINIIHRNKVTSKLFFNQTHIFKFILDYYSDYGQLPSKSICKKFYNNFIFLKAKDSVEFYVNELRGRYKKAVLYGLVKDVSTAIESNALEKGHSIVLTSLDELSDIILEDSDCISENIDERYKEYVEGEKFDFKFGWEYLDETLLGIKSDDLVTVIGRQGVGKTWFLILLAKNSWEQGKKVLFISKEVGSRTIIKRFDSIVTGISYLRLRKGQLTDIEKKRLKKYLRDTASKTPLNVSTFSDSEGLTSIVSKIVQIKPDIVFIDGAYLLAEKSTDWKEVTRITRKLKAVALRYKIPFIVSTQADIRSDKEENPGLHNVSYTQSFGQDSDIALSIHQNKEMKTDKVMLVETIKNREGDLYKYRFIWDFDKMLFNTTQKDIVEENIENEVIY